VDHEHLRKRDVFTIDFLDMGIAAKRSERDALRPRPPSYEFPFYCDVEAGSFSQWHFSCNSATFPDRNAEMARFYRQKCGCE